MNMLRSSLGLMAVAALACLAMASPAAADIAPFALSTSVSHLAAPAAGDIVRTGPAVLAASTDTIIVPSEVGTLSRDAVCVPAGLEAAVALDSGTIFAPSEVGAGREIVRL